MSAEERRLSEMLHRVTPEPPRGVTVEDVASRQPRERRGWNRRWTPLVAAASVLVVAGASALTASVLTSHHASATPAASGSAPAASTAPAPKQTPAWPPERVAQGIWGAELIDRATFTQDTLVGGDGSLYAMTGSSLDRIDPATGNVLASVPFSPPLSNPPAVIGTTVWAVASYGSGVTLRGFDATTLAQVASVTVPMPGGTTAEPEGILAASSGSLYVAAGSSVAVIDSAARHVARTIKLASPASSVAIAPDGTTLYVGLSSFRLLTYDAATGALLGSSSQPALTSPAGNLLATSGGVWGTTGDGISEWTWFAPDGDLSRMVRVSPGAGAGLASVPTLSDGTVWVGGSQSLLCADPGTAQTRDSVTIPADGGVAEYVGSVVVTGGHAYAYYQNQHAQQSGVARLTPPAACSAS